MHLVREMLDKVVKISAQLVHMGSLQIPMRLSFLAVVQQASWNDIPLDYTETVNSCRNEERNLDITRIFDVAQDLKVCGIKQLTYHRSWMFSLR